MAKKRYKPEEIVIKLRQVEVLQSQGMVVSDAIRQIGVSEVTYYRWRKEYRGMAIHQLKRLKEVEKENEKRAKEEADARVQNVRETERRVLRRRHNCGRRRMNCRPKAEAGE